MWRASAIFSVDVRTNMYAAVPAPRQRAPRPNPVACRAFQCAVGADIMHGVTTN